MCRLSLESLSAVFSDPNTIAAYLSIGLIYAVFVIPICSVYCNTLLANLNARAYIRGEETVHDVDVDFKSFSSSSWRVANISWRQAAQTGQSGVFRMSGGFS